MSSKSVRSTVMGAFAIAAIALGAASAHAATYTFTGNNSAGVDPLGAFYTVGPNFAGFWSFQEAAGEQPDPTNQVTFHAGHGLIDATSFTFTETGAADPLNQAFDYDFTHDVPGGQGVVWSVDFVSPTEVTFTAPTGDELVTGDQFLTYVGFQNPLPNGFSYTITWGGAAAAPEPAAWAVLILGFFGAGAALRRRRKDEAAGLVAAA